MRRSGGGVLVVLLAACVAQPELRGPLPVRNQHPAQLTVLHLPPAPAAVLPRGAVSTRLDAAYTSLWLVGSDTAGRRYEMDGEYLRTALSLRAGLGRGFEFGVEVPVGHTSGGFLDSFVIDYHDALGLPDQNRDSEPRDEFAIEARRGGTVLWRVERDGFELLDVPLSLTWQVADPAAGPGLALRAGIELPTGDADRGYGSGELDASLGALLEHRALGCGFFGHVQHTFAGTPSRSRDLGLRFADVTSAGGGVELPLGNGLAGLLQVEWETSTLRSLGLAAAARDQLLLWAGFRLDAGAGWDVELGFGEDLQGLVSPDFTAWLAVVWRPDRG